MVLLALAGLALWMLDVSLSSANGFASLQEVFSSFWFKLLLWVLLAALAYHLVAGIRHLVMDLGIGESLRGGVLGARLVLIFTGILVIATGVWLWG